MGYKVPTPPGPVVPSFIADEPPVALFKLDSRRPSEHEAGFYHFVGKAGFAVQLPFPQTPPPGVDLLMNKQDAFSIRETRAYYRTRHLLGAPDPDGWRGREHISPLFLSNDDEAHSASPSGDWKSHWRHPRGYLHEHAGRHLSVFLKKISSESALLSAPAPGRGAAHVVNACIKRDAPP